MEQYKRNNFFNTKKYVSNKETYQSGILMKFIVVKKKKKEYLTRIFFFFYRLTSTLKSALKIDNIFFRIFWETANDIEKKIVS